MSILTCVSSPAAEDLQCLLAKTNLYVNSVYSFAHYTTIS